MKQIAERSVHGTFNYKLVPERLISLRFLAQIDIFWCFKTRLFVAFILSTVQICVALNLSWISPIVVRKWMMEIALKVYQR